MLGPQIAELRVGSVSLSAMLCLGAAVGCGDGIGTPLRADPGAAGGSSFGGQGFGGSFPSRDSGVETEGDVPPSEHCAVVEDWPPAFAESEDGLVQGLNAPRVLGLGCDVTTERRVPAPFVTMTPELRCSARLHARDMRARGFFATINPDGEGADLRMARAGYASRVQAEVIAAGDYAPHVMLQQLIFTGGADCENLLSPAFTAIGVGVYEGLWVIDLAGP